MRGTLRGASAHSCLRSYYVKEQASNEEWSREQQSGLVKDKSDGMEQIILVEPELRVVKQANSAVSGCTRKLNSL